MGSCYNQDMESLLLTLDSRSTKDSTNQADEVCRADIDDFLEEIIEEAEFDYVSDRAVGNFYDEMDQQDAIEYPHGEIVTGFFPD
jgi:hypothetical protein